MKNETACHLMKPGKGRQQRNSRVTCGYGWRWGTRVCVLSASGFGPAPGRGRLPAGGRGQGLASPLPPATPYPLCGSPL